MRAWRLGEGPAQAFRVREWESQRRYVARAQVALCIKLNKPGFCLSAKGKNSHINSH